MVKTRAQGFTPGQHLARRALGDTEYIPRWTRVSRLLKTDRVPCTLTGRRAEPHAEGPRFLLHGTELGTAAGPPSSPGAARTTVRCVRLGSAQRPAQWVLGTSVAGASESRWLDR